MGPSGPIGGSRLYLGSWLHTAPDVRFWPKSDLSMKGTLSSGHLTKVAKVSWRVEKVWSCQGKVTALM